MISSLDFPRLLYRKPHFKDKRSPVRRIAGLDSETYTTGEPFMFCSSRGDTILPADLLETLFTERYVNTHFFLYNLTFDTGSILYRLPEIFLKELWEFNKTQWDGYTFDSVPHKYLKISRGKDAVWFWDIRQYYGMSLDNAAKKYLGKSKIEVGTKNFSPAYVKIHWNMISKYCVRDATLTEELARYFIEHLEAFGITTSSFYSGASISAKYFSEHCRVVDVWRYWKHYPKLLEYATDSYEGGKFEVTAAGSGTLYEYDISSAYPFEIANLVDIRKARVKFSSQYQKKAVYGFLKVKIIASDVHLPCGIMEKSARLYPQGCYYTTITKQEYDYCKKMRVSVKILSAYWLFVKSKVYPYRKEVNRLFKIKSDYKGKDPMTYNIIKIILNSWYGKMAQVTFDKRKRKWKAGMYWNPIFASIITANTRIRVSAMQNKYRDECVAVHTDSILLTRPAAGKENTTQGDLGDFEYVTHGPGTVIACGMYQIGALCAFKGFDPVKGKDEKTGKKIYYTWKELLTKHKNKTCFSYPYLHVETWYEAMAKNHGTSAINVFHPKTPKKIDLNCDVKRKWPGKFTGAALLKNELIRSEPLIRMETKTEKGAEDEPPMVD